MIKKKSSQLITDPTQLRVNVRSGLTGLNSTNNLRPGDETPLNTGR